MKPLLNKILQGRSINLNLLVVVALTFIFMVSTISKADESNVPKGKVKKYVVQKDESGELMKDESGNFIFVPVYVDKPEPMELPSVTPPFITYQPAPSLPLKAKSQKVTMDIGPEMYSFNYKEPGFMEEEGTFYGVRIGYTFRDWLPDSTKESPSGGGSMFRAEGRFAKGQVDYDGALLDGTPKKTDGIDDFAFEGRLLLGGDWLGDGILNTLYAGMGYRYLNDDSSFDPSGYERESNYLYLPVGYEIDINLQSGWSWMGRVEFDYLLWGMQRSHLRDFPPYYSDFDDRQNSGHGYRTSIRFQHKSKDVVLAIEPFYRYWDINKSEVNYDGGYEPANETKEIGIQLFWIF